MTEYIANIEKDDDQRVIHVGIAATHYALLNEQLHEDQDAIVDMPIELTRIEGSNSEIRERRDDPAYIKDLFRNATNVVENLQARGHQHKATEIAQSLLGQIGEDALLGDVVGNKRLSAKDVYPLLFAAVAARSKYGVREGMYHLNNVAGTGINTRFDVFDSERTDPNANLMKDILELIETDDNLERSLAIAEIISQRITSDGMSAEHIGAADQDKETLVRLLTVTGLTHEQAASILDAMSQSTKEEYKASALSQRLQQFYRLAEDMSDLCSNKQELGEKLTRLYTKYNIRNFHRYNFDDIKDMLDDNFVPEELVVTAYWDTGGALARPAQTAKGISYKKPAFYEAEQPVDIIKAIIDTSKTKGKPLEKILIRAHGAPDGFTLGRHVKRGEVDQKDVDERAKNGNSIEYKLIEKGYVDREAEVIFESCSLGAGTFQDSIYKSTGLRIHAATDKITGSGAEEAPGVLRLDGMIYFGTSQPTWEIEESTGYRRKKEDLTLSAEIKN